MERRKNATACHTYPQGTQTPFAIDSRRFDEVWEVTTRKSAKFPFRDRSATAFTAPISARDSDLGEFWARVFRRTLSGLTFFVLGV